MASALVASALGVEDSVTRRDLLARATAALTMVGLGPLVRIIPSTTIHQVSVVPVKPFAGGVVTLAKWSSKTLSDGSVRHDYVTWILDGTGRLIPGSTRYQRPVIR